MLASLVIVYRSKKVPWSPAPAVGHDWLFWSTCIRQLAFGHEMDLPHFPVGEEDQVYRGSDAFRFLLEVVSGLQSPLVGETEVFGQFKQWVEQEDFHSVKGGLGLKHLFLSVIRDVKLVRQQHLNGLGSQSYGSLARKRLKNYEEVHFLGSGALTKDMLPWLLKTAQRVVVHARSPHKVSDWPEEFPGVEVRSLDQAESVTGALIVAAPMSSEAISDWKQQRSASFQHVLDLRGECVNDPLRLPGVRRIEGLPEIFKSIEETKRQLQERVEEAQAMIAGLVKAEESSQKVRPFGWDDLCA